MKEIRKTQVSGKWTEGEVRQPCVYHLNLGVRQHTLANRLLRCMCMCSWWSACLCLCVCTHACIQKCAHTRKSEGNLRCVIPWDKVAHWPGTSPNRLGQLASQESAWRYLASCCGKLQDGNSRPGFVHGYLASALTSSWMKGKYANWANSLIKKINQPLQSLPYANHLCIFCISSTSSVNVCLPACWGFVVSDRILLGSPGGLKLAIVLLPWLGLQVCPPPHPRLAPKSFLLFGYVRLFWETLSLKKGSTCLKFSDFYFLSVISIKLK